MKQEIQKNPIPGLHSTAYFYDDLEKEYAGEEINKKDLYVWCETVRKIIREEGKSGNKYGEYGEYGE